MTASQFKKKFGVTHVQGSIILRTYNNDRHNYKKSVRDKDKTVESLKKDGYLKMRSDLSDEEAKEALEKMRTLVQEAHDATSSFGSWERGIQLLLEVARLRNAREMRVLKLTTEGVELAQMIGAEGLDYHQIWLLE